VSGRQSTRPLEEVRLATDTFARQHPRLVGGLVTIGSLYVMVNLGLVLFSGK
jgi:hypothetical protein